MAFNSRIVGRRPSFYNRRNFIGDIITDFFPSRHFVLLHSRIMCLSPVGSKLHTHRPVRKLARCLAIYVSFDKGTRQGYGKERIKIQSARCGLSDADCGLQLNAQEMAWNDTMSLLSAQYGLRSAKSERQLNAG